jgi:hypothetical protein
VNFIFLKIYIFLRAGGGKISGKKTETNIYVVFFSNLYFLEGWPRANRRQKNEQNVCFFWGGKGGLAAEKSAKKN